MNTTKNKHPEKDLKDQGISPEKLLKIALVVLMIVPLGYFLYITLEEFSPIFSRDTEEMIHFFFPMIGLMVLFVLFFLRRLKNRTLYNPYTEGELPTVIRIKGVNNKVFQGVSFVCYVCFNVWILRQITMGKPLLIAILIVGIVLFVYSFIKNYPNTLYTLEIRNESIYFFYKGTLKQTIPLKGIHHIYFSFVNEGIATRIYPQIKVYTSKKEYVLHMKVSRNNYYLLRTFFSQKHIKLIDDYILER
jgi:hypothetical protein